MEFLCLTFCQSREGLPVSVSHDLTLLILAEAVTALIPRGWDRLRAVGAVAGPVDAMTAGPVVRAGSECRVSP